MRLGGPILDLSPAAAAAGDPADWVAAAKALGYRAVYCPLDQTAPDDVVRAYEQAATAADLVMAEVGSSDLSAPPPCTSARNAWPWPTASGRAAASTSRGRAAPCGTAPTPTT
jgi:hypothetical protein